MVTYRIGSEGWNGLHKDSKTQQQGIFCTREPNESSPSCISSLLPQGDPAIGHDEQLSLNCQKYKKAEKELKLPSSFVTKIKIHNNAKVLDRGGRCQHEGDFHVHQQELGVSLKMYSSKR